MAGPEVYFTLFYVLLSLCVVFPPTEFVSAGLTVHNLLSRWIPSEDLEFVHHHIRRTAANVFVHSCIPAGYVFGLWYSDPRNFAHDFSNSGPLWHLFCSVCLLLPVLGASVTFYWYYDGWQNHPICQALASFSPDRLWGAIALDINREFRRIDKICIRTGTVSRVVATDNWVMKVAPYGLKVAHQSDVALVLVSSDHHQVSIETPGRTQFLNIEVKSARSDTFRIRVNSLDLKDLQDKIHRPIANIGNIRIERSLADRFLEAFKELVYDNEHVLLRDEEELEPCIGCMQNTANVKLFRCCGSDGRAGSCVACYCRPMWCLDCMGKWFASRQDQNRPDTWLGSKCPCPTCRSLFCVLDVCLIDRREE